ncbi:hypothetical protein ANCCAN_05751 [Ancylostoma caninum]|uniref:Uncharacterized protein n=1 Tax=Ancylostoma caninum TaxID=29170 RepID=A0A368GYW4_ANCCA|nr:hypothetical protein ANCCAN_05751 [Ancylostoma caninum]
MSAPEAQTPSSDDNILTRHKHIAESIEMIRVKKDQLLRTLRGLSTSENVRFCVWTIALDQGVSRTYGMAPLGEISSAEVGTSTLDHVLWLKKWTRSGVFG